MKINTLKIVAALMLFCFQSCKAQQSQNKNTLPKIENYTKGELEIKVETFGSKTPISVGKITADGNIHFNFPKLDLNAMGENEEAYFFSMRKMGRVVGLFVCHDKEVAENTESVGAIEVRNFFLYKYGQIVGEIRPATQKEVLHNDYAIGSSISWFYSDGEGKVKATCIVYEDDENASDGLDRNTIRNKTSYDISFKEGWNIVTHRLLEKKDMTINGYSFSRRLIEEKKSVATIPSTINWYMNYTANDELLEIEHQLFKLKPITKQQYESWLPKKLGNLKRTSYEVGKTLERMPTLNNVNLLFEKGSEKVDLTIVDCAGNKDATSMYTLMQDMSSRDWKDKTETGYRSASKIDDTRVMTTYNEKEAKTTLNYNANGRFLVKAEGTNIKPTALWEILKGLQIEKLIKE
jgi:hypothetical protein